MVFSIYVIHESVDPVVRGFPDEVGKSGFFDRVHHADAGFDSIGIHRPDRDMLTRYVEKLLHENRPRHVGGCGGTAAASPA